MDEAQWAALTLQDADLPVGARQVDEMMQWMTAEEPTDDWYDRSDPLNASLGQAADNGTGTYPDLAVGALYTAKMIRQANMAGIYNALRSGAADSQFSSAVVSSPWSSDNYGGNPNHIAQIPVPSGTVEAPSSMSGTADVPAVPAELTGGLGGLGGVLGQGLGGAGGVIGAGLWDGFGKSIRGAGAYLLLLSAGLAVAVAGVWRLEQPNRQTVRDVQGDTGKALSGAVMAGG